MHNTTKVDKEQIAHYRELRIQSQKKRAEYLANIPKRNLEIARLRYEEQLSLAKIGERFGISRQRVNQILNDF
jgi:DNA-directed RNA polymerase specialized sigma subunit